MKKLNNNQCLNNRKFLHHFGLNLKRHHSINGLRQRRQALVILNNSMNPRMHKKANQKNGQSPNESLKMMAFNGQSRKFSETLLVNRQKFNKKRKALRVKGIRLQSNPQFRTKKKLVIPNPKSQLSSNILHLSNLKITS